MPPATRPILRATALVALTLVISACSSPSVPSLSSDQTAQALAQGQQDAQAALTSFEASEAGQAVGAVGGTTGVMAVVSLSQSNSESALLSHSGTGELDRHTYSYDAGTGLWNDDGLSGSGNLEHHWTYAAGRPAVFTVDWESSQPTLDVNSPSYGGVIEVPQGLRASLQANGPTVGQVDATIGYFESDACGITDEVTSVSADGYLGVTGDKVTIEGDYAVSETSSTDTISTSGDIDLVSGAHQTGVDWSVTARGTLSRTSCYPGTFSTTSGSASLGAYSGSADARLAVSYDNVSADDTTGMTTFDINGSLTLNGQLAVNFAGTFDDANGDSVPGDNVTLTFAGETMTLEQYIKSEYQVAATTLKVLSVLD